ncbi:MAG TPA: outer membrane lipoprotein carrier protein LolA [bacterium]|nr:outer membrane lipoprotein carrier protein LolA [bacterium]
MNGGDMFRKAHFVVLVLALLSCGCLLGKGGDSSIKGDEMVPITKEDTPVPSADADAEKKPEAVEPAEVKAAVSPSPAVKKTPVSTPTAAAKAVYKSPEEEKIDVLMARLKRANMDRHAMSADISVRTVYMGMDPGPAIKGSVIIKGEDKFKVHYTEPKEMEQLMVSDGETLWVYTPAAANVIVQKVKDAGFNLNFYIEIETSIEYYVKISNTKFSETENLYTLVMTPKKKQDLEYDKITVKINKATLKPVSMAMDFEGSVMEVGFSNIVNYKAAEAEKEEKFSDSNFTFTVPKGVDEINAGDLMGSGF